MRPARGPPAAADRPRRAPRHRAGLPRARRGQPPRRRRRAGDRRAQCLRPRGRGAPRRADPRLRARRFERWLAAQEVMPTVAALRERADEIVDRVLAENEPRWESLSEADRERVELMARAIASRLLHEPTLRIKAPPTATTPTCRSAPCGSCSGSTPVPSPTRARAPTSPPRGATAARATAARRGDDRPPIRLGTRGSALALAQAEAVAEGDRRRRGWSRSRPPVEPIASGPHQAGAGDKARFVREIERALLAGEVDLGGALGQGPPERAAGGARDRRGPRARGRPRTPTSAQPPRSTRSREGARVGTSSLRRRAQLLAIPGPTSRWSSSAATSTPASGGSRTGTSTGSSWPRRGCAGSGARRRSRSSSIPTQLTPAPGQGALALEARRRRRASRRGRARSPTATRSPRSPPSGRRSPAWTRAATPRWAATRPSSTGACGSRLLRPARRQRVDPRRGRGRREQPRGAGRGPRRADDGRGRGELLDRAERRRRSAHERRPGIVYLVGAGPGDPGPDDRALAGADRRRRRDRPRPADPRPRRSPLRGPRPS